MLTPLGRLQRALVIAVLVLPVLAIIILSFPVWISWPWLKQERRTDVLELVDKLTDCLKALMKADQSEVGKPEADPGGNSLAIPRPSEVERADERVR